MCMDGLEGRGRGEILGMRTYKMVLLVSPPLPPIHSYSYCFLQRVYICKTNKGEGFLRWCRRAICMVCFRTVILFKY